MRYFITGGCGFLGSNIAAKILEDKNGDVLVFDNLSRVGSDANLGWLRKIGLNNFHPGDVREYAELSKAINEYKPDCIFHLAGQVAMTTSISEPLLDFEINALGTLNALEAARNYSNNVTFIYSSTNKVYGELDDVNYLENEKRFLMEGKNCFDESLPIDFRSPYGCSKGAADQYVLEYARTYGINAAVFRHSSIFGNRQYSTADQGWVGWFIKEAIRIRNGEINAIQISGNGKQVRDILFSSDLVKCYLQAAQNSKIIAGNAYNIGGGFENSMSLIELFEILECKLNIKIIINRKNARLYDQKVFVADNTKAFNHFGWRPEIDRNEGISKMIDWVISEN